MQEQLPKKETMKAKDRKVKSTRQQRAPERALKIARKRKAAAEPTQPLTEKHITPGGMGHLD